MIYQINHPLKKKGANVNTTVPLRWDIIHCSLPPESFLVRPAVNRRGYRYYSHRHGCHARTEPSLGLRASSTRPRRAGFARRPSRRRSKPPTAARGKIPRSGPAASPCPVDHARVPGSGLEQNRPSRPRGHAPATPSAVATPPAAPSRETAASR